jgi:peptidoglycan/xylan/chitin deacetylase (PgdA/CDA1 family)/spore germination protein YaaH
LAPIVFVVLVLLAGSTTGTRLHSDTKLRSKGPSSPAATTPGPSCEAILEDAARPTYSARQRARARGIRQQEGARRSFHFGPGDAPIPLPRDAVVAFVEHDDTGATASLERHVANVDVVVPDWFDTPADGCQPVEAEDAKTRRVLRRADALILPRLTLPADGSNEGRTSRFLHDADRRACFVKALVGRVGELGNDGVDVRFEPRSGEDGEALFLLLGELRVALHAHWLRLTVDVPLESGTSILDRLGPLTDAVLLDAYDQHSPETAPGPLAARDWFGDSLDRALAHLPIDRVAVIMGGGGIDWTTANGHDGATRLPFSSVMEQSHGATAAPTFETRVENGHVTYREPTGTAHDVWFQDALATWNQVLAVHKRHVRRIGLSKLGSEDETVWTFLGADAPPRTALALNKVLPLSSIHALHVGEGYSLRSAPESGERRFALSNGGQVTRGRYTKLPTGYVVDGIIGGSRQVALTFDDGPSKANTGAILDILKEYAVPATFFVAGRQVLKSPEIFQREQREGHLLGNHSWNHPEFDPLTPNEARLQFESTGAAIESLGGVHLRVLRPPYRVSLDPQSPTDSVVLATALAAGYVFVGANADSLDWQGEPPDVLIERIVSNVELGRGRILLFHDGGNARPNTVEAVRRIVPELRQRGYEFVPLDRLLGKSRVDLEPKVSRRPQSAFATCRIADD